METSQVASHHEQTASLVLVFIARAVRSRACASARAGAGDGAEDRAAEPRFAGRRPPDRDGPPAQSHSLTDPGSIAGRAARVAIAVRRVFTASGRPAPSGNLG